MDIFMKLPKLIQKKIYDDLLNMCRNEHKKKNKHHYKNLKKTLCYTLFKNYRKTLNNEDVYVLNYCDNFLYRDVKDIIFNEEYVLVNELLDSNIDTSIYENFYIISQ